MNVKTPLVESYQYLLDWGLAGMQGLPAVIYKRLADGRGSRNMAGMAYFLHFYLLTLFACFWSHSSTFISYPKHPSGVWLLFELSVQHSVLAKCSTFFYQRNTSFLQSELQGLLYLDCKVASLTQLLWWSRQSCRLDLALENGVRKVGLQRSTEPSMLQMFIFYIAKVIQVV